MIRLCLILTTIIVSLASLPAYADEPLNPVPTAQLYQASLPLVVRGGGDITPTSTASVQEALVALVNIQRSQVGCPALTINPQLTQAAQTQAQDMAQHNFLGHIGTDGSNVETRVDRTGYNWQILAENLSVGHPTVASAVIGWMGSAAHRANILDCSLRETGIGFVYLPNDAGAIPWSFYWAEVFATR